LGFLLHRCFWLASFVTGYLQNDLYVFFAVFIVYSCHRASLITGQILFYADHSSVKVPATFLFGWLLGLSDEVHVQLVRSIFSV